MNVRQEIERKIEQLPLDMQEQVLRFVSSLATSTQPIGEGGAKLRQFSSVIDPVSAQEMTRAIEEGCERVDAVDW